MELVSLDTPAANVAARQNRAQRWQRKATLLTHMHFLPRSRSVVYNSIIASVALGMLLAAPRPAAAQYTVTDITPTQLFSEAEITNGSNGQQVGFGFNGHNTGGHALLWSGTAASAVDLTPSGYDYAFAASTSGGQQVGYSAPTRLSLIHATLWSGTAASAVDLHPQGFRDSQALGNSGTQQVGLATDADGFRSAMLWSGSAASAVNITPVGFSSALAVATNGSQQVGGGSPNTSNGDHALLWSGSAASAIDLHPQGYSNSFASSIFGTQQVGSGSLTNGSPSRALLWLGSAASVIDLTPSGYSGAAARGTNGVQQVGAATINGNVHALIWSGSASSFVDLNTYLPPGLTVARATSIDAAGNIYGSAGTGFDSSTGQFFNSRAIVWTRSSAAPEPCSLALFLPIVGILGLSLWRRTK